MNPQGWPTTQSQNLSLAPTGPLTDSGLDLEKQILSPPVEAELFFLTSLFIELIDLKKGEQTAQLLKSPVYDSRRRHSTSDCP